MAWLLRATALISLAWAVGLSVGRELILDTTLQTPIFVALANGLALSSLVFAFLFWRAAGEAPPNRTVIYGALLLLLLKVAADLYELLYLLEGAPALLSLADLVISIALAVGIIEAMPRAFGGPAQDG